jgi:hypothetical protein
MIGLVACEQLKRKDKSNSRRSRKHDQYYRSLAGLQFQHGLGQSSR